MKVLINVLAIGTLCGHLSEVADASSRAETDAVVKQRGFIAPRRTTVQHELRLSTSSDAKDALESAAKKLSVRNGRLVSQPQGTMNDSNMTITGPLPKAESSVLEKNFQRLLMKSNQVISRTSGQESEPSAGASMKTGEGVDANPSNSSLRKTDANASAQDKPPSGDYMPGGKDDGARWVRVPYMFFGDGWPVVLFFVSYYGVLGLITKVYDEMKKASLLQLESDQVVPANQHPVAVSQHGFGPSVMGSLTRSGFHAGPVFACIAMSIVLIDELSRAHGDVAKVIMPHEGVLTWETKLRIYFFLWLLVAIQVCLLKLYGDRLHRFFLWPRRLTEAKVVAVDPSPEEAAQGVEIEFFNVHPSGRYFVRYCLRWIYLEESQCFVPLERLAIPHPLSNATKDTTWLATETGLHAADAEWRLSHYGPNVIEVPTLTLGDSFIIEMWSWACLYPELMLLVLPFWGAYTLTVLYGVLIFLATLSKAHVVESNLRRISEMAAFERPVKVKRTGQWHNLSSKVLVPGDIIAIEENQTVPADLALLHGFLTIDEAMLTGETMPVQKFAAPPGTLDLGTGPQKHLLHTGTMVLASASGSSDENLPPNLGSEPALVGIVLATGVITSRGELIRDILRPKTVRMKHHDEVGNILMIVLCIAIIVFITMLFKHPSGSVVMDALVGLFNVSTIMNPILPAVMLVGESVACARLEEKELYVLVPSLVMVAGKLRVFCFDKTGTLTKEGLQLIAVHEVVDSAMGGKKFQGIANLVAESSRRYSLVDEASDSARRQSGLGAGSSLEPSELMQVAMGTCHTVSMVQGKPVGNPAEIEMFAQSGWSIVTQKNNDGNGTEEDSKRTLLRPETFPGHKDNTFVVLRLFEFDHHLMTQSVILENDGRRLVLCKGAYERVQDHLSPGGIVPDYLSTCEVHARRGCYVLAVGWKELSSDADVLSLRRAQVENDLELLGLLLFRNEPKEDTYAAVQALREGHIRLVVVTGDNALTGIHIARKVSICDPLKPFKLAKLDPEGRIIWINPESTLPDDVVDSPQAAAAHPGGPEQDLLEDYPEELAITGEALQVLERDDPNLLRSLLLRIRVFGRVKPMQKVQVIEWHKALGLVTGMCGDGGNDCGALKAAHVGVALSEAEASIVSPFNAKDKSVFSCDVLVREGCAALTTSFSLFKYIIVTGMSFVLLKTTMLLRILAFLPGMAYIYYEILLTPLLCAAIAHSKAAPKLTKYRPTSSLLGSQFIYSTLGLLATHLMFLFVIWFIILTEDDWLKHFDGYNHFDPVTGEKLTLQDWWKFTDTFEGSALWVYMAFVHFSTAAAVSHGHRFRQAVFENVYLCGGGLLLLTIPVVILWTGPNVLTCLFRSNCDADHIDSAFKIPILPYLSREFWEGGFYAPGQSNVLQTSFRLKVTAACVGVFVVNQLVEHLLLNSKVTEQAEESGD